MNHFCLVVEPTDLDAIAAASGRATGRRALRCAGLRVERLHQRSDGNTVELRFYEES